MSWVSENKFLTGFGAVMLAGVGTLGYLIWSGMDKYEAATGEYEKANNELKRLQDAKPALKDSNLKALLAQKQEMADKISAFQGDIKSHVLPTEPIAKVAFQDKLKENVAQISAKASAARIVLPKDFYLGFGAGSGDYQSRPPDDKAAPALARELRALDLVMNVLIKARDIELEEFHREPLPEENAGPGKKKRSSRGEGGPITHSELRLKFTSDDRALREVLVGLANQKEQLFVIRNLAVQNKVTESPPRVGAAPTAPITPPAEGAPGTPPTPAPTPAPEPPAAASPETALAYLFGTERITSIIELDILNIEEPKSNPDKAEKPDKGSKKKDK